MNNGRARAPSLERTTAGGIITWLIVRGSTAVVRRFGHAARNGHFYRATASSSARCSPVGIRQWLKRRGRGKFSETTL